MKHENITMKLNEQAELYVTMTFSMRMICLVRTTGKPPLENDM